MQLREYQIEFTQNIAYALAKHKRIIAQLATGGGKTISFSSIVQRYAAKNDDNVLILVHRVELLKQTRRTLYDKFGITAEIIDASTKHVKSSRVYLAMVETFKRREYNLGIGLLIIDEAHLGNFTKVLTRFTDCYIIGFTATPLSAKKKEPLNLFFNEIVCGIDIPELIASGGLVPCRTYAIKNVTRSEFNSRMGEFDEKQMETAFSRKKQLDNCLRGYEQFAKGQKTMVFNVNVQHSKKVNDLFVSAGYNSRHLDGACSDSERANIFDWFANTPDAILHNVGIATTGTDIPSVQCVITNFSTQSLPKWLQTTGRGARPYMGKEYFTIIDLGNNAQVFGEWSDSRNWRSMFHNPQPHKEGGVAAMKDCPTCFRLLHVRATQCPECGTVFDIGTLKFDDSVAEFELLTKGINVEKIQEKKDEEGRPLYSAFFHIGWQIGKMTKGQNITPELFTELERMCHEKSKEWCHLNGKRFNQWHKEQATNNLKKHLNYDNI